jgi:hypothetical protein
MQWQRASKGIVARGCGELVAAWVLEGFERSLVDGLSAQLPATSRWLVKALLAACWRQVSLRRDELAPCAPSLPLEDELAPCAPCRACERMR